MIAQRLSRGESAFIDCVGCVPALSTVPIRDNGTLRGETMFGRKTPKEKLTAKYEKLLQEAYQLASSNRRLSDEKTAEAERVREQLDALEA